MEKPIVIHFRLTADDWIQAYRYHFRHICRPVFRFALHFIFALMLVAGGLGIRDRIGLSVPVSLGFLIGGVYWLAVRPFERRRMIRRQLSERPDRDMELEWRITDDKICTQSGLGHSELIWQAFTKMVRTPSGVMFYPTDQFFHWLPRRGFASDSEFERLVELARSKIQRHFDVA